MINFVSGSFFNKAIFYVNKILVLSLYSFSKRVAPEVGQFLRISFKLNFQSEGLRLEGLFPPISVVILYDIEILETVFDFEFVQEKYNFL